MDRLKVTADARLEIDLLDGCEAAGVGLGERDGFRNGICELDRHRRGRAACRLLVGFALGECEECERDEIFHKVWRIGSNI